MIAKISHPKTRTYRYIGSLLVVMVADVLAGTAPASAGWTYALTSSGKCCMTATPPTSPYYYPPCNPPIWLSATPDRCRNIPVTGSKTPAAKR